jgi:hypothetical protein
MTKDDVLNELALVATHEIGNICDDRTINAITKIEKIVMFLSEYAKSTRVLTELTGETNVRS